MNEELQQNQISIIDQEVPQKELDNMYKYVLHNSDQFGQVKGPWFYGGIDRSGQFKFLYVRELKSSDNVPVFCWTIITKIGGKYKITNTPLTQDEEKEYKKFNRFQFGGKISYLDIFS